MAIDTSALMAILLDEPDFAACIAGLEGEAEPIMSAGTLVEALIVAAGRGIRAEMMGLVDGLAIEVIAVTSSQAQRWRRRL